MESQNMRPKEDRRELSVKLLHGADDTSTAPLKQSPLLLDWLDLSGQAWSVFHQQTFHKCLVSALANVDSE